MTNEIEMFHYDDVERLTTVMRGDSAKTVMKMNYASNGNISSKTGLGLYGYETPKPHAVTSVKNSKGLLSENPQSITYTAFNKLSTIEEKVDSDTYNLSVAYGPDQQRWKTTLKKNGNIAKTTIFADDYEAITENGATKQLYYIGGGDGLVAIYVRQTGQADKIYYPHQDHLGSIMKLTDGNGTEVFKASYDAWGNQTISNNTFAFHRGYTGHEHLKEFKLINMNGRMYDPIVGRFLSPDPYVQMPDFSQNFNRYSYCLNNPLRFTDPSGEIIHIIAGALIGGVINLTYKIATGQVTNFESGFLAFGIGAAGGALAAVVGPAAFAAAGGSGAVIGSGGFMAGFVAGGSAYLTHTAVQSTGNHLAFGDKFPTAGEIAQNFSFAALSGGVLNGLTAVNQGRNFWNGDIPRPGASLWSMNSTSIYSGTSKMEMRNLQNVEVLSIKGINAPESKVAYQVTKEGVVIPADSKYSIPSNYIENPYSPPGTSSYGTIQVVNRENRFVEKLRIDPATPINKKGPNYSHYHLDKGKEHFAPGKNDPGFNNPNYKK